MYYLGQLQTLWKNPTLGSCVITLFEKGPHQANRLEVLGGWLYRHLKVKDSLVQLCPTRGDSAYLHLLAEEVSIV